VVPCAAQVPASCHGLPHEELQPHEAWGDDEAYAGTLTHLARLFVDSFKQYLKVGIF
jgi:ATP-dependent phosphoenolpyruvate carboxykinase